VKTQSIANFYRSLKLMSVRLVLVDGAIVAPGLDERHILHKIIANRQAVLLQMWQEDDHEMEPAALVPAVVSKEDQLLITGIRNAAQRVRRKASIIQQRKLFR
jgi:hypothetical protein